MVPWEGRLLFKQYRVSSNLLDKEKFEYPCQFSTEWTDFFSSEDNTRVSVYIHQGASIDTYKYSPFFFIHFLMNMLKTVHSQVKWINT